MNQKFKVCLLFRHEPHRNIQLIIFSVAICTARAFDTWMWIFLCRNSYVFFSLKTLFCHVSLQGNNRDEVYLSPSVFVLRTVLSQMTISWLERVCSFQRNTLNGNLGLNFVKIS